MIEDRHVPVRKLYRREYITIARRRDQTDEEGSVKAAILVEFEIHRDKLIELVQALPDQLGGEAWSGPLRARIVAYRPVDESGRWGDLEELPDNTP